MKKHLIIIAAVLLAAATAIIAVSCQKEKQNENEKTIIAKKTQGYEPSEMDKAMMAFGNRMKSAALEKSGETMSLAEALTTLSNYQNFSMCDASYYSTEMTVDTFRVSLNVTNGEVSLSDLYDVYETTETQILSRLASLDGNQKAVYSIWCFVAEATKGNLDDYTGRLDVDVVSHIRGNIVPGNPLYFGSTDYWYDFDTLGKCGPYVGQCVGSDCVDEIRLKLASHIILPNCGPGYRLYLTNQITENGYSSDFPDSSSPNGHYALPWRSFWDDPQCVSPSEMNDYLQAFLDLFSGFENTYSKDIAEYSINKCLHYKYENHNKEIYFHCMLADVNCVFVGLDD